MYNNMYACIKDKNDFVDFFVVVFGLFFDMSREENYC